MDAREMFTAGLADNRAGRGGVAVSVCSAHPDVLRAAFRTAAKYKTFALIESTSNQVDQYGGYTGMRPPDFVHLVRSIAAEEQFPWEHVLLGGDHLGPNTWQSQDSEKAMAEARDLVAAYVRNGYGKIHLDASFVCRDDEPPLTDDIVAARCADMALTCERECEGPPPLYVVGTEVPTPGGAFAEETLHVTTPEEVEATLGVFKDMFYSKGLEAAWERVVGLVIQPGVEFGDNSVHPYESSPRLSETILGHKTLAYEAHSTDYQTGPCLRQLAVDHYYILKVGPWLTYALREGLFLLEAMEGELSPGEPSNFRGTLLHVMREDSRHWKRYYQGTPEEVEFKLKFSYSDRARYYLAHEAVRAAQKNLLRNLAGGLPESLVSQYMPRQYDRIRSGELENNAHALIVDKVCNVLELYMEAGRQHT